MLNINVRAMLATNENVDCPLMYKIRKNPIAKTSALKNIKSISTPANEEERLISPA